jgi:MFS family permease
MDAADDVVARPVATTLVIAAALVAVMMPAFLVGASGVMLRAELGFGEAGLGLAISVYFGAFALSSLGGGRLAERLGGGRSLGVSALASAAVLMAIGTSVQQYAHLVALLAVGGAVQGLGEPSTNLAMARSVAVRPAFMFGVKQAAVPVVTLLAGASVPVVGTTIGWRWSFIGMSVLAVVVAGVMPWRLAPPRPAVRGAHPRAGDSPTGPLVALAFAAGVGAAPAVSLGSFLVEAAVAGGISLGLAGWLMVAGSLAAIGSRLSVGWLADRVHTSAFRIVSIMLVSGAIGYVLLATSRSALLVLGTLFAFAGGWGWLGLVFFAVSRRNPNAPGAASGIVLAGAGTGAALGPFAFGAVASAHSYGSAWALAACAAATSAVLVAVAGSRMSSGVDDAPRATRPRTPDPTESTAPQRDPRS